MKHPKRGARERIAVVGGGVAGIVAAYLLQRRHGVTLFEKNGYLGGHTHTIEIQDGPDAGLGVDTGFIVLNDQTYPYFETFLDQLGVPTRVSEMSFGFHCQETGLVYGGSNLNGLFAQRRNLVNPRFLSFILEIGAFCRTASRDLRDATIEDITLGEYLDRGGFSPYLIDNYLEPMAAAIWSTPLALITDFPARPFLHFFRNHGLLSLKNRPVWKTVVGGSHTYVKKFRETFDGTIRLGTGVQHIRRRGHGVHVRLSTGQEEVFEHVVIATHANQALRILSDPSNDEQTLLSVWDYQKNRVVLHTDVSLLPPLKRAWCAWNFRRETYGAREKAVFVTYYMNRLQGLNSRDHYCVTLNRKHAFEPTTVIAEMDYHHPLYSAASVATQGRLPNLNGQRRTYFCGSYHGHGFHEDAVRSAVAVGRALGSEL